MQLSLPLLVAMLSAAQGPEPKRPQTPQPPFPYVARDVSFASEAGIAKLAGTLILPKSNDRSPCVILVPGAGPVDRDNNFMGHKPFLVIADYLARHGIAALRLDSRGIGGSTGNYSQSSGEDLAGDLLSSVKFLRTQPEVDPRAIGLIGHSQGGTVAAIAAANSTDIRFLVLLAAPGLPDAELFTIRIAEAGAGKGLAAADVHRIQEAFRQARDRMLKGEADADTRSALEDVVRLMLPSGMNVPPQALAAGIDRQIAAARAPNNAFFLSHDPRKSLERVSCPVLALNGSKDQNVPAKESLAAMKEAFERGKNAKVKIVEIEGLNHFFQTAVTGSSMEAGQIEETISPRILELVAGWVQSQSR